MNHANRSTVVGGGDMKRATSGAVRIDTRGAASPSCTSRRAQCSPVRMGTASRQEHGGVATGSGRVTVFEREAGKSCVRGFMGASAIWYRTLRRGWIERTAQSAPAKGALSGAGQTPTDAGGAAP